jgi:DNA-binding beta-propeller fold protein YncE
MSDLVHNVITILNPATGDIQPVAGMVDEAGFVNDTGTAARFSRPYGLALASDGALLVADQNNHVIRRVTLSGEVTTFAGTGAPDNQNGIITGASFNLPQDVAIAGSTIYIADQKNHLIRRIDGNVVTTFAGNGIAGFKDAKGLAAEFFGLEGIAVNADGSILWIADGNGGTGALFNRVRRLATDE